LTKVTTAAGEVLAAVAGDGSVLPSELYDAADSRLGPGITRLQAVLLALAELTGTALDPLVADDAAVLLHAEHLVAKEGLLHLDAIKAARIELAESRRCAHPRHRL
jgi:hypothetical protein